MSSSLTKYLLDQIKWLGYDIDIEAYRISAKEQYNAGIVEGVNANIKLRFRKAYGFRTFDPIDVALHHEPGDLPLPATPHRF